MLYLFELSRFLHANRCPLRSETPYRSPSRRGGDPVDGVVELVAVQHLIDALGAVGYEVRVLDYSEHALTAGGDASAAADRRPRPVRRR